MFLIAVTLTIYKAHQREYYFLVIRSKTPTSILTASIQDIIYPNTIIRALLTNLIIPSGDLSPRHLKNSEYLPQQSSLGRMTIAWDSLPLLQDFIIQVMGKMAMEVILIITIAILERHLNSIYETHLTRRRDYLVIISQLVEE